MRPVHQTYFAVPVGNGEVPQGPLGNCYQACLASILDAALEDVPHFAQQYGPSHPDEGPVWWLAAQQWIRDEVGLYLTYAPAEMYPTPRDALVGDVPDGFCCIAGGPSPRGGWSHVVVVDADGHLLHDPHPSGDGLAGPPHGYDLIVSQIVEAAA